MKYDEMTCFRCAVAVAVTCMEDERPQSETVTPQQAADYICNVLDIVFAYSGIECTVVPMLYPACSKIPLIIRLSGLGTRLFWFHTHAAQERVAQELEGTLHDLIEEVVAVSA